LRPQARRLEGQLLRPVKRLMEEAIRRLINAG
jgi:hypothetical protein